MSEYQSIDSICDAFESAWQANSAARIEGFLTAVAPDERRPLLKALLEIEFELLLHNGKSPDLAGYQARFPNTGSAVADAMRATQERLATGLPSQRKVATPSLAAERPSADRNLLFGVQAWQTGVITEKQLLDALKQWTFNKSQPLSDILVHAGAITPSQRDLLQPLVEAQIRLHQDNAGRALSALSSVSGIAGSLKRNIDDSDVQQSLGHLAPTVVPSTLSQSSAQPESTSTGAVLRYTPISRKVDDSTRLRQP